MLVLSNVIRRVFTNRYRVVPRTAESEFFEVQIDIELNKNENLKNKAKFFEVNFYANQDVSDPNISTFKRVFPNRFLSRTNNLTKYSSNPDFAKSFKKDIRKNLYTNYHTKFLEDEGSDVKDLIDFRETNFIENSNVYRLTLSRTISNIIKDRSETNSSFNNIRIFILDENKSIISKTQFLGIDLSQQTITKKRAAFLEQEGSNLPFYLSDLHISSLINNLNKDHFVIGDNNKIQIYNPIQLSYEFKIRQILLKYFPNEQSEERITYATLITSFVDLSDNIFDLGVNRYANPTNISKLEEIQKTICKNIILGLDSFKFEIEVTTMQFPIASYKKEIIFQKNDAFIMSCFESVKNIVAEDILSVFEEEEAITIENNNGILDVKFNNVSESFEVLEKLRLSKVYKNNKDYKSIDYFYSSKNFNVNNRIDFKSLTMNEIISIDKLKTNINYYDNKFTFNITLENPNVNLEKEIQIEKDISLINNNDKTLIDLNSFLNQNLRYNNINFNRPLSNNKTIFTYDTFTLLNLNLLQPLAYNLGYVLDDNITGDVKDFLRHCIFHIENETTIKLNGNPSNSVKNIYKSGSELFDFENFQNNFVVIKENIKNTFHTDDSNNLSTFYSSLNDFFNTQEENKFLAYTKLNFINNDLLIKNKINIKSICFPEIMTRFFYPKSDFQNNFIVINEDVNHTASEEELLNNIATNYLQTQTNNRSYIDRYINILYKKDLSSRIQENKLVSSDFASIFSILLNQGINESNSNSFYRKRYSLNKLQILELLNINRSFPEVVLNSENRSFENTFYNLNIDDSNFVNYTDLPISYSFMNTSYNQDIDGYNFSQINFTNSFTDAVKINFNNLSNFFDQDFVIRDENIKRFKTSLHLLYSDQKNNISQQIEEGINNNPEDYYALQHINYKGKKYLTYNSELINHHENAFTRLKVGQVRTNTDYSNGVLTFNNIDPVSTLIDDFIGNRVISNFIQLVLISNNIKYMQKIVLRSYLKINVKLLSGDTKDIDLYFNHEISPINLINQYRVFDNNIVITNINNL